MKILMMTNTYTPFVGGVPRSVQLFTEAYRERGHRTIVVAPEFEDNPEDEQDVIRMPAIKNVSEAGFSVRLPIPGYLANQIDDFDPDIVHAHHPFLLGDTALRIARQYNLPLVFTHHTLYEQYTHYLPVDVPVVEEYVINLVSGYCNLCDEVFAPSGSVADLLRDRGVETPIDVIPTGIDVDEFGSGDGESFRNQYDIPEDVFLVGHLGRLAEEKNLPFLGRTVAKFLDENPESHFLLVGEGPTEDQILDLFDDRDLADRLHHVGILQGQDLYDAYASMDVFAFASTTETQGMVLVEAMSSGTPVVALDASGSRDVIVDHETGRLVESESVSDFSEAMEWVKYFTGGDREELEKKVIQRAREFSMDNTATKALNLYSDVLDNYKRTERDDTLWETAKRRLETEWQILRNFASATDAVIVEENND